MHIYNTYVYIYIYMYMNIYIIMSPSLSLYIYVCIYIYIYIFSRQSVTNTALVVGSSFSVCPGSVYAAGAVYDDGACQCFK